MIAEGNECEVNGALRLKNAQIGGDLRLQHATLCSEDGPALHAESIQIGRNAVLNKEFRATGSGEKGAVCLIDSRIKTYLALGGAVLRNASGPAIEARDSEVGGSLFLNRGFDAEGHSALGTVGLLGAKIVGDLDAKNCNVTSTCEGQHMQVNEKGAMRAAKGKRNVKPLWNFDGLTYRGVPNLCAKYEDNIKALFNLLRDSTPAYAAQPYQQLASAYRAQGHESDVREVLMEQRKAQLVRGALTERADRFWAKFTGLMHVRRINPSRPHCPRHREKQDTTSHGVAMHLTCADADITRVSLIGGGERPVLRTVEHEHLSIAAAVSGLLLGATQSEPPCADRRHRPCRRHRFARKCSLFSSCYRNLAAQLGKGLAVMPDP